MCNERYDNNMPPVGYDGYSDEGHVMGKNERVTGQILFKGVIVIPNPQFHPQITNMVLTPQDLYEMQYQRGLALAERMDREGLPTE